MIHSDDWCKPCAKEVAKKGKPNCGTVQDRLAADVLEYQVGPFKVKPYAEYMKKQGIVREQVDKACADYGITIDPRQFEVKKRPRKPRDMAASVTADAPSFDAFDEPEEDAMTAATCTEVEEQLDSEEEDDFEPPAPSPVAEPTAVPTAPSPVPTVISVVEVTESAPSPVATAPEPAAELAEEPTVTELKPTAPTEPPKPTGAPLATITPEQIAIMDKETVKAHCKARGLDVGTKGHVQLKKLLGDSISASRSGTKGTNE
jgi:hypothetical protein